MQMVSYASGRLNNKTRTVVLIANASLLITSKRTVHSFLLSVINPPPNLMITVDTFDFDCDAVIFCFNNFEDADDAAGSWSACRISGKSHAYMR